MDNKEVNMRRATHKDVEVIHQMICVLEKESFDSDTFKSIFVQNLANPQVSYFVAEVDNKVVGFISLHIQSLLHHNGNVGEIQELFVDENYRGYGIGKQLLKAAEKVAQENRCKVFEVACNMKREKTHQFYEREGLSKTHYKFTKPQ